jgi:hypothetical protein
MLKITKIAHKKSFSTLIDIILWIVFISIGIIGIIFIYELITK